MRLLCYFSSWESFDSISAQGSESSHPGATFGGGAACCCECSREENLPHDSNSIVSRFATGAPGSVSHAQKKRNLFSVELLTLTFPLQHRWVFGLVKSRTYRSHRTGVCVPIQHRWVFDLVRVAQVRVIAQGCAPKWETKSITLFSVQGSESSHPCAKKSKLGIM